MFAALRRHPLLTLAFGAAAAACLGLLAWSVADALDWDRGAPEPVAGWMTVGYVARAWDLDPREIDALAGLPLPQNGRPFTLSEIAADRGVPVEEILRLVERTVAELVARRAGGDGGGEGG